MSQSKLKPAVIKFYATTSQEELEALSVKERMESIHLLTRQMFNEAARQMRTESAIPSPRDFPREYKALTNLAKSFSHSTEFSRTIIRAADRTVDHVRQDDAVQRALCLWPKIQLGIKKSTLNKLVAYFMDSSSTLLNVRLIKPQVVFYHEEKDEDGDVTQGYYTNMDNEDPDGSVFLNTHKDAFFNKSLQAAATALHEAVHAVQDQIGLISDIRPALVKPYKKDGALARAISEYDALIDYRMDTPYRAQFHERLAFSADERFYKKLQAVLK